MQGSKVALITGASSGIGEATAKELLKEGFVVYGSARRVNKLDELKKLGMIPIQMDVTVEEDLVSGIRTIEEAHGGVDLLINNAGYGSYGAIEDVPLDEARRQFEVNIFGLARLTQLVLPGMRKNRWGKIVNISSIGGKIYTPFGGWYHATKHALEGLSDCLRIETAPFGIDVVVVEPGGIETEWGAISAANLEKTSAGGAYAEEATRVAKGMSEMYSSGKLSQPSLIAKVILKAVTAKKPRTRYAAGYMSGMTLTSRRLLTDRMFDSMLGSMM